MIDARIIQLQLDLAESTIERLEHELVARREIMRWVANKLLKLRELEPHEWDRSTLLELAEALTSNPKLRPDLARRDHTGPDTTSP